MNGTVKLGKNLYENPRVMFFERLTHLNLGYGFIHDFAITIDQANRRIRLLRATATVTPVAVMTMSPSGTIDTAQYAGTYGERQVTVAEGKVFLQRMSGPHGQGPRLGLDQIRQDEFGLPGTAEVRFKFVRDSAGKITELKVLNQDGVWESAVKASK